ncbi:Rv3654c family TadE-like protein [Streptomyces sp. CC210A]|uniref:Rv3654c family TadE-like protein n=1 Tax=unclassified Streptomyces TaxID=2593676 RepID=UPI0009A0D046|nr:Rv3654c family TadE-like protein [Streptomyces sp. CC210A]
MDVDTDRRGGRPRRGRGGIRTGGGAVIAWPRGKPTGDGGSATVWATMVTGTLCFVFAAVLALGQAVAARHRAGGAADLAALAAADTLLRGPAAACEAAARVAEAQHTELVRCTVHGEVADVTARARLGPYTADVRARAGPADPEAPAVPVPAARAPTGPDVQDIRPRTGGAREPPEAGDCAALPAPGTASGHGGTRPRGPGRRAAGPAAGHLARLRRPAGTATPRPCPGHASGGTGAGPRAPDTSPG